MSLMSSPSPAKNALRAQLAKAVANTPAAPPDRYVSQSYSNRSNCRAGMKAYAEKDGTPLDTFEIIDAPGSRFLFQTKPPVLPPAPVVPADGSLPDFLNQTAGKTKEEIAAVRAALNRKQANKGIAMPKIKNPPSRKEAIAKTGGSKPVAGGSKKDFMVGAVCVPGGTTEEAICKAMGWKACMTTLRRACDEQGVTLTRIPVPGDKSRYIGTRKGQKPPTAIEVKALGEKYAVKASLTTK